MPTFDVSGDWVIFPDQEPITLLDPLGTSYGAINGCLRLGGSRPERAPSYGKYLERKTDWLLPYPNVAVEIEPRWVLQDQYGVQFTVLSVTGKDPWHSHWRCTCNSLEFDGLIDDTVTYWQVSAISSDTTERRVIDTQVGGAITCAIEPERDKLGEMYGTKDFESYYRIYLNIDPSGISPSIIKAGDLLKDQNAVVYEIDEVLKRERIDQHLEIVARVKL